MKQYWRVGLIKRLRELAETGMHAGEIGKEIGRSQASVITFCGRRGIAVVRYSPEQQAMYDRRALDREQKRQMRKVAANKKKKLEQRLAAMERSGHSAAAVKAASSQSSVGFRKNLPPAPEMTKNQLRAMLAEAVRNTAGMSV